MNYYDTLILEYYRVLNIAWKTDIKDAARFAIQMLSDMSRAEKVNQSSIDKLMGIIAYAGGECGDGICKTSG